MNARDKYDYVIVGSGIAGLYAALVANEHGSVLVLTKGTVDECNTRYAQGGIAAAVGQGDSPRLHLDDTLKAGAGLCDVDVARIVVEEGPDRIYDLISFGVPFDTDEGEIALAREGAHSMSRVLHAGGDATGANIERTLTRCVMLGGVDTLEHHLVVGVDVEGNKARGLTVKDLQSGECRHIEAGVIVLGTGGAGQLYRLNTNPDVATGDGVALAYSAGAEVMDLEFFQFHPTALRLDGAPPFLISEAVRGEGGILKASDGRRFMGEYDPRGELASRDIVARAITSEMRRTGADFVLLDVTGVPKRQVITRFPSIYSFCLERGLDITCQPIPVAPAAHYMIGGVRTGQWGETTVAGLYACGEVACTGLHGANRLASNSLLEGIVFAKRIVEHAVVGGGAVPRSESAVEGAEEEMMRGASRGGSGELSLKALQSVMWDDVGIRRNADGLRRAIASLGAWMHGLRIPQERGDYELRHLLLLGGFAAVAALNRTESRGVHYREDCPNLDSQWVRHVVFRRAM